MFLLVVFMASGVMSVFNLLWCKIKFNFFLLYVDSQFPNVRFEDPSFFCYIFFAFVEYQLNVHGLFLGSLFCSIGLCLLSCQYHTILTIIAL
jgi:hypothetical protein